MSNAKQFRLEDDIVSKFAIVVYTVYVLHRTVTAGQPVGCAR